MTIIGKISNKLRNWLGLQTKYISYIIPLTKYKQLSGDYYNVDLVRCCIDYISNSASKIPLHFFDVEGNIIDQNINLSKEPNTYQSWTTFVSNVFKQKLLNGYCVLTLTKNGIEIINETISTPINDEKTATIYYSHPNDPNLIYPITQSIVHIIERHQKALEAMHKYLDNSIFAGILSAEFNNNTYVDAKILQDAENELMKKYGGSENFGKVGLVKYPLKFTKTAMNVNESGILDFYLRDLQDISRAFGIPSILIGDNTNTTYNNVREARIRFYEDTIMPQLDELCEVITKLLKNYLKKLGYPDAYLSYLKNSIPNERNDRLLEIYLKMYQKGDISKEEMINFANSLIIQ